MHSQKAVLTMVAAKHIAGTGNGHSVIWSGGDTRSAKRLAGKHSGLSDEGKATPDRRVMGLS